METRVGMEMEEQMERHYSSGNGITVVSGIEKYIKCKKDLMVFLDFSFCLNGSGKQNWDVNKWK